MEPKKSPDYLLCESNSNVFGFGVLFFSPLPVADVKEPRIKYF